MDGQAQQPVAQPHTDVALRYAQDVVARKIPACKWVRAACQRQLDDLARWSGEPGYPFDWRPDLVERACRFVEKLRHVKGRWFGTTINLEPFQKFSLACVFGWVLRANGTRRFRTVYEEVPRKNAKTTKMAGVGLYMLVADGEWGGEVYSAATTFEQAFIVFEIAQQMVQLDGPFRARFGVTALTKSLTVRDTASKMMPLTAEGTTLDGLNVSCALIDELHAHKTRAVHDVLDSGTGSRAQPLIWKITTAGSNRAGVCFDQRQYLTKILNTVLKRHGGMGYKVTGASAEDDRFWGIIYTIDDGDDPLAEASWIKANPNWGVSVDPEDMRRLATVAKVQQAALANFMTKRLNVWVSADAGWMNMLQWDACADPTLREEDFEGERCIVALDAAFKKDLFAKVKVFERDDDVYVFGRYYMPQALADARGNEQVLAWAQEGWIRVTPGQVLDIRVVKDELLGVDDAPDGEDGLAVIPGDVSRFEIAECGFDPFQLQQFASEMIEEGVPMVEIRATVANFSPAMKEIEELVAGQRLHHNGDPVLAWMVGNVVCHFDRKDNIYPNKASAADKIDGAVALIMAISRLISGERDESDDMDAALADPIIV